MAIRFRRHSRKIFFILILLAVAGWVVPQFFSAERYRRRVQLGLEQALGRKVSFSDLSLHLLPRPGFSLTNVVIGEDPAFGAEPFARVDRMDCDLRLRSLLRWRVDLLRLSLDRPSFNIVRNSSGQWNLETLLGYQSSGRLSSSSAAPPNLHLETSGARINFKLGDDKEPFVIDGADGYLDFDRARHGVRFHLAGSPLRTDLLLPSPGEMEFEGEWIPGADPAGPLDATLTASGAMLYDWVPILTGGNPNIYGVMNARAHLTGSFRVLNAEGRIRLSQLHRWDQPPPSGGLDSEIFFRGQYDREHSRLAFESLDAGFADSHLHLTGSVDGIGAEPRLDLVLAVERSRLEDFQTLAGRFTESMKSWRASGRMDALMTVQGPWSDRHYGGFIQVRDAKLDTSAGSYPVSEIALRIDRDRAQLAPVRLDLAPHVSLVAEGTIERKSSERSRRQRYARPQASGPFEYKLNIAAKSVPVRYLMRFARSVGVHVAEGVDARGDASAAFTLAGPLPLRGTLPEVEGRLDLHAASLLIPGLTEPLNVPKARIQIKGRTITADPVVAVLGTSVFTGRLEHSGERGTPWHFDVRANALSIEQGALWFDALGNRQPVPLLLRLPGLRSLVERRTAASNLFNALNARGRFSTPRLTYRALLIHDVQANVNVGGRVIRAEGKFRAGGGHGTGKLAVDLTQSPARVAADATLADAQLRPLAPYLAASLRQARGTYSVSAHLGTQGLSRQEITTNLEGRATVRLRNVNLGEFDPLAAMARAEGRMEPLPVRGEAELRSATLKLQINDKRVTGVSEPFALSGADMRLGGWCNFDGTADFTVTAGLRGLARQVVIEDASGNAGRSLRLHLTGPFNKLAVETPREVSRGVP
jgi:AsmA family